MDAAQGGVLIDGHMPALARWPAPRRRRHKAFSQTGGGVRQVGADRAAQDLQRARIEQLAAAGGAAGRSGAGWRRGRNPKLSSPCSWWTPPRAAC
ncbi:hypothetical protein ACHMW6_00235 (plasmid) [Pseudoduganella sp. UC29_106]|uniref:hypothetical protein n=1 Tax=Pseudoduganella sp. UC29_106 TaxID=3374553 RepID=UPI003757981D